MSRLILASTLAAMAMFVWGFLASTRLGSVGISPLPNEPALLDLMRANIPEKGLYFFPGVGDLDNLTEDQQRAWMDKIKAGPNGLLLFDPAGHEPLSARQILTEIISDFLGALLLCILLGFTNLSLWGRVGFGATVGLMAWLTSSVGYWNWYGFPTPYVLAEGFGQVIQWALAALVLTLVMRRKAAPPTTET
ncbi:MAG TPA: hypothetical protein VKB41_07840 [Steroidobacteraceae bacterium]|jgi:hypothetical protein|nr:hypothetical protein [Steroidobacteraceae bacterium]